MAIGKLVQKDGKLLYSTGDLWSADDATTCNCACGGDIPDPCTIGTDPPLISSYNATVSGFEEANNPGATGGAWTSWSSNQTLIPDPPTQVAGLNTLKEFRLVPEYLPRIDFLWTFDHIPGTMGDFHSASAIFTLTHLTSDLFGAVATSLTRMIQPMSFGTDAATITEWKGENEWDGLALSMEVLSHTVGSFGLYPTVIRYTRYFPSRRTTAGVNSPSQYFTQDTVVDWNPCVSFLKLSANAQASTSATGGNIYSSMTTGYSLQMNVTYNAPP
jgi:hypothetical protein